MYVRFYGKNAQSLISAPDKLTALPRLLGGFKGHSFKEKGGKWREGTGWEKVTEGGLPPFLKS